MKWTLYISTPGHQSRRTVFNLSTSGSGASGSDSWSRTVFENRSASLDLRTNCSRCKQRHNHDMTCSDTYHPVMISRLVRNLCSPCYRELSGVLRTHRDLGRVGLSVNCELELLRNGLTWKLHISGSRVLTSSLLNRWFDPVEEEFSWNDDVTQPSLQIGYHCNFCPSKYVTASSGVGQAPLKSWTCRRCRSSHFSRWACVSGSAAPYGRACYFCDRNQSKSVIIEPLEPCFTTDGFYQCSDCRTIRDLALCWGAIRVLSQRGFSPLPVALIPQVVNLLAGRYNGLAPLSSTHALKLWQWQMIQGPHGLAPICHDGI